MVELSAIVPTYNEQANIRRSAGAVIEYLRGGVRTWETAVAYLDQGCKRLGVGSTVQVLSGPADSEEKGASNAY